MKKLIWYLGALLLFYGCPVDREYIAEICNNRNEDIELVTKPEPIFRTQANDKPLKFMYLDSLKNEYHYLLLKNSCSVLFGGIGELEKRNMRFDYLEIRTSNDTIIHSSREEIWEQFKSEDDYNYVYNID